MLHTAVHERRAAGQRRRQAYGRVRRRVPGRTRRPPRVLSQGIGPLTPRPANLSLVLWDAIQTHGWVTGDRRFLVVRDPNYEPLFYDVLLNWLALYLPDVRALF